MAEKDIPKSKRDLLGERLKSKHPEAEWADDEAMYGQINDDYEDYEQTLSGYREREGKFTDMLRKDPRSGQFIADMARGNDPIVGLIRRIGKDGITAMLDDPAKQEEFAKANQEFVENLAEEEKLQAQYQENLRQSLGLLDQIKAERGLSEEQMDAAFELIGKTGYAVLMGEYTQEAIDMALKYLSYDADLQNAQSEGEVRGRNAKIEEKLRKPQKGDGLPQLGGGSAAAAPKPERRRMSVFDQARMARG